MIGLSAVKPSVGFRLRSPRNRFDLPLSFRPKIAVICETSTQPLSVIERKLVTLKDSNRMHIPPISCGQMVRQRGERSTHLRGNGTYFGVLAEGTARK